MIAIVISAFALGFSVWVYFKHDKKIKSLEKEKLEREAMENKRARFDVQCDWLFVCHILCLQNIGKSTANKIIQYRNENGYFDTIEDLMKVSGIGENKYNAIKEDITIQNKGDENEH